MLKHLNEKYLCRILVNSENADLIVVGIIDYHISQLGFLLHWMFADHAKIIVSLLHCLIALNEIDSWVFVCPNWCHKLVMWNYIYIVANCNPSYKDLILVVSQQILSCSPKAFTNVAKNNSKIFKISSLFQIEQIKIGLVL